MKKLLSAAAMAALIAGAASADVSITMNARVRGDAFEMQTGSEAKDLKRIFSLDNTDAKVAANSADTIKFSAKNDYAGIELALTNNMRAKTTAVDTYTAWLKFGKLTLKATDNAIRTANRVTTDQNNVSLLEANLANKGVVSTYTTGWAWADATVGNSGKLGINKNIGAWLKGMSDPDPKKQVDPTGAVGVDVDSFTGSKLNYGAEYGVTDELTLRAYLNASEAAWNTNDDGKVTNVNSQYSFQADYNLKDTIRVTADAHLYGAKKSAYAVFVSPLMVENLAATVGFTFAKNYDDNYWALDARARYAFDPMAVTLHANVTGYKVKSVDDDSHIAMDFVGNFNYNVNDLVKVFVEAEYASLCDDSDVKKIAATDTFETQLGAILTAGKNATVTPAVRLTMSGIGSDKDLGTAQGMLISIPVVTKIAL